MWAKLETSPCIMHLLFQSIILNRSLDTGDFNNVFKDSAKLIFFFFLMPNSEYIGHWLVEKITTLVQKQILSERVMT